MTPRATTPSTHPGVHPSVEQIVAALHAAGDRVVVRHPDGETTGAELLAAISRFASRVADLAHDRRIAAVQPWGAAVDRQACRDAVAAEYGDAVAATLVVLSVDDVPLTEQGKPDRAAISARAVA